MPLRFLFPTVLLLLLTSSCDQLVDQRRRAEPPALPPVYIEPEPFVSLTPSKMQVVYVGVDNPLDLRFTGADFSDLSFIVSPPGYIKQYEKNYALSVSEPGLQDVKVMYQGKVLQEFTFRVKPLPEPVARLGSNASGLIHTKEFKAQLGLSTVLSNFDFDIHCTIMGFQITRYLTTKSIHTVSNTGAMFEPEALRMIQEADPGDVFIFTNIEATCQGDETSRSINALVFNIY